MSSRRAIDAGHSLDDRICHALARQQHLVGRGVQYQVVDGDVVLTGAVRSFFQKQMAQESLRRISGIRRIVNDVQVVSR